MSGWTLVVNNPDRVDIIALQETSWAEFRALRLRALREEPQAFGQSYEVARAFPDAFWEARFQEVADGGSWLMCARIDRHLVGMVGAFQTDDDRSNQRATIVGTYVDAAVRGRGIGRQLLAALLDQLVRGDRVTVAHLGVNAEQAAAVHLYREAGFHVVGEESLTLGDGLLHRVLMMEKRVR